MKYDILEDKFSSKEEAVRIAVRVSQCRPFIRQAIDEWLETDISPTLVVTVEPFWTVGKKWELSAEDLMIGYNMQPLDALLFLDWLLANDESSLPAWQFLAEPFTPNRLGMKKEELLDKLEPEVRKLSEELFEKRAQNYARLEQWYNKKLKGKEIYHD